MAGKSPADEKQSVVGDSPTQEREPSTSDAERVEQEERVVENPHENEGGAADDTGEPGDDTPEGIRRLGLS